MRELSRQDGIKRQTRMLDHTDHRCHACIGQGGRNEAPPQSGKSFYAIRPRIEAGPNLVHLISLGGVEESR